MTEKIKSIKELQSFYTSQSTDPCLNIYNQPYGDLAQVVLIRHGQPELEKKVWYNRQGAAKYAEDYGLAEIKPFDINPICADSLKVEKIYHSSLPRARHTASLLFGDKFQMVSDSRFREFEKNIFPFFNIHLPLKFWNVLSRLLWYFGFNSREIENVKQAKLRARSNADFLSSEAFNDGLAVVVAHGFHNRYVIKYLKKKGWKLVRKGGRSFLSVNILAKMMSDNKENNHR